MGRLKCAVPGCVKYNDDYSLVFFKLPQNCDRLEEWCKILKIPPGSLTAQSKICGTHFDQSAFLGTGIRLKPDAVPLPNLIQEEINEEHLEIIQSSSSQQAGLEGSCEGRCCIGNCTQWVTHARSFHPLPSNVPLIRSRWCNFVRRSRGSCWKPKDESSTPMVCNLHFSQHCFYGNSSRLKPFAVPDVENSNKTIEQSNMETSIKPAEEVQTLALQSAVELSASKPESPTSAASSSQPSVRPKSTALPSQQVFSQPVESLGREITQMNHATLTLQPASMARQVSESNLQPIFQNHPLLLLQPITPTQPHTQNLSLSMTPQQVRSSLPSTKSILIPEKIIPQPKNSNKPNPTETPKSSRKINTATSPLNFLPNDLNFCLFCNADLKLVTPTDPSIASRARTLLATFLNINLTGCHVAEDSHPICHACNYKVLDLQVTLDEVIAKQKQLEEQRDSLLREIVSAFCIRAGGKQHNFTSSSAVQEAIVNQWASKLDLPFKLPPRPSIQSTSQLPSAVLNERKEKKLNSKRAFNVKSQLKKALQLEDLKQKKEAREKRLAELKLLKQRGLVRKRNRDKRRVQCPVCNLEILQGSLKYHMDIHTSSKKFKCNICEAAFLREGNLRTHVNTHQVGEARFGLSTRTYMCPCCSKWIFKGRKLFTHIASEHPTEDLPTFLFYHCDYEGCNRSLSNLDTFREHILQHSSVPLECSRCPKIFASHSSLVQHAHIHSTEGLYDCPYCHQYFNEDSALQSHLPAHQIKVDLNAFRFMCHECGKKFASANELCNHQAKHRTEGNFASRYSEQVRVCPTCGKSFHSETNLQFHAFVHTHPDGFTCDSCGQVFPNPARLLRHQKSGLCGQPRIKSTKKTSNRNVNHEAIPGLPRRTKRRLAKKCSRFPCEHCEFVASSLYLSRRHGLLMHPHVFTEGKPCICRVCWTNFETDEELLRHQNTLHEKHICKVCSKVFGNLDHLRTHNYIHTGERPYQCNYCEKSFRSEPNRTEHENRHTGHKPYQCEHCSAGFLRKNLRDQHIERAHGESSKTIHVSTKSESIPKTQHVSKRKRMKSQQSMTAEQYEDFSSLIIQLT